MGKVVFFESFFTLAAILAVLISLYFYLQKQKKKKKLSQQEKRATKAPVSTLNTLMKTIKTKTTSTSELQAATNAVIEHYGNMHEDFNLYINMILIVCNHPNTNKDIIIRFEKGLRELNPEFKNEVSKTIMQGLNSRKA